MLSLSMMAGMRCNKRSLHSRKEPNLGTLQVTDTSPKLRVKKPRQKKNEKKGSTEDLSPGRNLKISPGHNVTSVDTKQVHWNIPDSSIPEDKVTRGKSIATKVEEKQPTRNKKTAKSKGNIETEESAAQKDTVHLAYSFPSLRKIRSRQLPSAAEITLSPTRRKQEAGVSTDAEVPSLPTQKQGNTPEVIVEELPSKKRRGANTVSSPKRKLRSMKLSDVGEEEKVSSSSRTRSKKPKVTSSPLSKAKSPPAVPRRGGRKTAKKEVSPQLSTGRQTRAASRRKK